MCCTTYGALQCIGVLTPLFAGVVPAALLGAPLQGSPPRCPQPRRWLEQGRLLGTPLER